jgi:integrase
MKGSVTKYAIKGSSRPRWRYRIDTGRDDVHRIQKGAGGFIKESEAREAMDAHIERIKARAAMPVETPPTAPAEKTVSQWLREWLEAYAKNTCQPKTLERYKQLAAYITDSSDPEISALANSPISTVSRKAIKIAMFALLRAKGKRREHLSARTVHHVAGLLSSAFSEAVELELLPANPMLRIKGLPTAEKPDVRALNPAEIRALRDVCRGDWTFPLVEVAMAAGCRRGELLALRWSDVGWESRTLNVSRSLEQTEAGLRIKTTKSKKPRHFELSKSAITALQFLREQQTEHRRLFAGDYKDLDLIFCQPNGDYLRPDLVSQVIVRRLRKAGITDASLHSLRHSNATNLLSKGVPVAVVSARLGHADPSITNRIYNHALPADDKRAADEWDEIVGSIQ